MRQSGLLHFVECVDRLYPSSLDESGSDDAQYLKNWIKAVNTIEITGNLDDNVNILEPSCCYKLLIILARYIAITKPPEKSGGFDYGREQRRREQVFQDIQQLLDTVRTFYKNHDQQMALCAQESIYTTETSELLKDTSTQTDNSETESVTTQPEDELVLPVPESESTENKKHSLQIISASTVATVPSYHQSDDDTVLMEEINDIFTDFEEMF